MAWSSLGMPESGSLMRWPVSTASTTCVVALRAVLAAQQLPVARGGLPVDRPRVQAGRVLAQRLELGAVAQLALDLEAGEELARAEEAQGGPAHGPHVGQHGQLQVQRRFQRALEQAQRALPAQPDRAHGGGTAPQRHQRHLRGGRLAPGQQPERGLGGQRLVEVADDLDGRRPRARGRELQRQERPGPPRRERWAGGPPGANGRATGSAAGPPPWPPPLPPGPPPTPARARPAPAPAAARAGSPPPAAAPHAGWARSSGGRHLFQDLLEHVLAWWRLRPRSRGTSTMRWPKAGADERLHVVGHDEVAAVEHGLRAGGGGQHAGRARRGAAQQRRVLAGGAHQLHDVVHDLVGQAQGGQQRARLQNRRPGRPPARAGSRAGAAWPCGGRAGAPSPAPRRARDSRPAP